MPPHVVPNPTVKPSLLHRPPASHVVAVTSFETAAGRRYRLFTAIPAGRSPMEGFPALYLLDGNAAFACLDADDLMRYPNLAVIAIGYETEAGFDFDARSRDYTPLPPSGRGVPEGSPRPSRPSGGARAFLLAILDEIIPALERRFPLSAERRTLWGHSYAGLFGLYAYLHTPAAFAAICAASPSLWWGDGMMLAQLAGADANGIRPALVLIRGEKEASPALTATESEDAYRRLVAILAASRDVTTVTLPSASHGEAFSQSIPLALELAANPSRSRP